MSERIKLGISTCLLGENVRYDGGHKLDHYLKDTLGKFVDWVGVCPEVECGLGIPRESMHLEGPPDSPSLITSRTHIDKTDQMLSWMRKRLKELEKEELSGFVFKSDSPSSGLKNVRIYDKKGMPSKRSVGIFAKGFTDAFKHMPVEEDGRLHDATLRENFIERVFVFKRWQNFVKEDGSVRGLVALHTELKLLIMAHSEKALRELGSLVAKAKGMNKNELFENYIGKLMAALLTVAPLSKNTNVLQHVMGYFKEVLSKDEKEELLEVITNYRKGFVPLVVPVTLLNHYVHKYKEPYLSKQYYLNPHPVELMLRNHV